MSQAQTALIASWIQGHWNIENALHWVRDVDYDEDRHQLRGSAGVEVSQRDRWTRTPCDH